MSFCSRTKNTHVPSPAVSVGQKCLASDYDPVVETFFIDFNIIRIMSEVMVDYVSVSLLCCCFLLSFFHFRIVRPKIRERILLQLFKYMREKNEIAFAHFENCFRMQLIHLK